MSKNNIIIEEIDFSPLDRRDNIRVYVPDNIDLNKKDKKYPVIYMHDGQNIYNKETSSFNMSWEVHNTIDNFIRNKLLDGIIVVGIDNAGSMKGRLDEYSPWVNNNLTRFKKSFGVEVAGGLGDKYATFIIKTLIPYIEKKYPVSDKRDDRIIAGSSMGGVISLYIGLKYQNLSSKILSMSTAVWFAEQDLLNFIKSQQKQNNMKIYLDIGDRETSDDSVKEFPEIYISGSKNIYNKLLESGFNKDDVIHILDKDSPHNEIMWQKRFPNALKWLLNI